MTKSLHIGFIAPFLFRVQRGIERSCIHLANALVDLGQKVTIMAWDQRNSATASPIDPRVRLVRVPYMPYYRARWAIPFYTFELLVHPYDVVNVFFAGYGEAQSINIAGKLRAFRTNFIAGYPITQVPYRFQEFRQSGLAEKLDWVIVKSSPMAEGIAKFFEREVKVIPNGIDVTAFDPQQVDGESFRQCLSFLTKQDRILLTVAALEERKGIQHVIKAMPGLLQMGLSVHYLVVGDGPYRKELAALAEMFGVAERVHFAGSVLDVRPYYQVADIFLLLSYGEGFPNVLLEAWAMALPVIVARQPPYPSIVPLGLGALIDEQNTMALQVVLRDWLTAPQVCQQIGTKAREYVINNYSWSMVAQQYLAAF